MTKRRPAPKIPNKRNLKNCGACNGGEIVVNGVSMRCAKCKGTGLV